jgi:hypothetical protein
MKFDKDSFLANMNMILIGEERQPRLIKLKSIRDGQWKKNEKSKSQQRPNATFDILMAKYKISRAGIRECENWTIWFPWTRSVPLQEAVHLASNPGHRCDKI